MCNSSRRLVAWMDGELAENESAAVEQHVRTCPECQRRVAAYEEVSRSFAAHYEAALKAALATTREATKKPRKVPLWVPVVTGAAAVAAVALLLALLPRSVKPAPVVPQVAETRPAIAVETPKKLLKPVQHRRVAAHRKAPGTSVAQAGPAIQITIPAEAMFPPGAVPEGVNYIANLSLADGSVQGLRLQP
jgi:anti-sigma factor RsiW